MRMQTMGKACSAAFLALLLVGGAASRAHAGWGTLTVNGTMDGSIDSTSFSTATFTAVASFDPSAVLGGSGYSAYPAIYTFDIGGVGTFTTVASAGVNAVVIQPPQVLGFGTYGVEIQDQTNAATAFYNAASTFLIPPGDWETLFSSPPQATPFEQSAALVLPLVGGGTLTADFDSFGATASLVIPEPCSVALLGLGIAVSAPLRRSRRR
jgi:hypothetical protein